jgi:hypothetical protein
MDGSSEQGNQLPCHTQELSVQLLLIKIIFFMESAIFVGLKEETPFSLAARFIGFIHPHKNEHNKNFRNYWVFGLCLS